MICTQCLPSGLITAGGLINRPCRAGGIRARDDVEVAALRGEARALVVLPFTPSEWTLASLSYAPVACQTVQAKCWRVSYREHGLLTINGVEMTRRTIRKSGKPLTETERNRRWRAKKKAQIKAQVEVDRHA